jgi:hypothetical protein
VFRDGTNWCTPHLRWLQHLTTEQSRKQPQTAAVAVARELVGFLWAAIQECSSVPNAEAIA